MQQRIKKTYMCKEIQALQLDYESIAMRSPEVGDVAIFEVLELGKHKKIQDHEGRNANIYVGDYIMAAFGTRYATGQFEGYVPQVALPEYHILGGGGTVGIVETMHSKFLEVGPTRLRPVAFVTDSNNVVLNTKKEKQKHLVTFSGKMAMHTKVVLSIGSSMDSGKTTTAAWFIRGLKKAGHQVAYIKLTGTTYTKDRMLAYDNGADFVTDFGELGFPSTYMCTENELLNLYETLLKKVKAKAMDYVIIEIADGLYQRETNMLLSNVSFMQTIHSVIFSAGDSLSAIQGVKELNQMQISPAFLSGLFSASPLLIKEVQEKIKLPVYTIHHLASAYATEALQILRRIAA